MGKIIKSLTLTAAIAAMSIIGLVWFYSKTLPDSYYVGDSPLSVSTLFSISSKPCRDEVFYASAYDSTATEEIFVNHVDFVSKISDSTLMLFDSIPIKSVKEKAVQRPQLVPGGQPFGIKLMTDGVVVVKMEKIESRCPASECGIHVGDVITAVNDESVSSNQQIADIISSTKGKPCVVSYKRDGEEKNTTLTPEYTQGSYKGGMWVRDSSAGIGTVTFYDPETQAFGGLGHPICDCDTKLPLPLSQGTVGEVEITDCEKSKDGDPGQLVGEFTSKSNIGRLVSNTDCGIFGISDEPLTDSKPIPMGFRQEVHTGKASIYATVNGMKPEKYDIEIASVNMNEDAEHDMIVKITDSRLLDKTGGIVQGMSGSPIIQDGRLVGAVTHVFVDDPQEGYGVFADSMYSRAVEAANADQDTTD